MTSMHAGKAPNSMDLFQGNAKFTQSHSGYTWGVGTVESAALDASSSNIRNVQMPASIILGNSQGVLGFVSASLVSAEASVNANPVWIM